MGERYLLAKLKFSILPCNGISYYHREESFFDKDWLALLLFWNFYLEWLDEGEIKVDQIPGCFTEFHKSYGCTKV